MFTYEITSRCSLRKGVRWLAELIGKNGERIGYYGDNDYDWRRAAKDLKAYEDIHGKGTVTGSRSDEIRDYDRRKRITK